VDLDLRVRLADLETCVDRDAAANFEDDVCLLVGLEACSDDIEGVCADGKAGKDVESRVVAPGEVLHLGCYIGDGDSRILDDRTGCIFNRALHVAGSGDLRVRVGGKQEECHQAKRGKPGSEHCRFTRAYAPHRSLQKNCRFKILVLRGLTCC
jgi:hypothetical protein